MPKIFFSVKTGTLKLRPSIGNITADPLINSNSILRHVAEQLGYERDEELEDLYQKTAWHFDRKEKKKAAAYDAFKKAIT